MNYRHSYHAGNFSDVLKHLVVLALIESLHKKSSPLCYLETHAGRGLYDLQAQEAQKTKEYQNGIEKMAGQTSAPVFIQKYLNWIRSLNTSSVQTPPSLTQGICRYFPGTALLAQEHLREKDRLVLAELHPEEHQALKKLFRHKQQAGVHHMDGYQALKAFLPPKEKRGIVLIDPPYEAPNELEMLTNGLKMALQKWPQGCYVVWYPIKDPGYTQRLHHAFSSLPVEKSMELELLVFPGLPLRLNGCGIRILNPPWQFENEISPWALWLRKVFTPKMTSRNHKSF